MKFIQRKEDFYARLQKLMNEKKVYTLHKLNRKELADMLDTNEKYLHDLIKEYTGLTYAEYIISLRLDHACRLLDDVNNYRTVDKIACKSSFSSSKTFYRQFRKHYNCSPAQYRKERELQINS
jgi:Transcriptional regulator containing an amidase domain and an AraC-type DNA-binding HTH domain